MTVSPCGIIPSGSSCLGADVEELTPEELGFAGQSQDAFAALKALMKAKKHKKEKKDGAAMKAAALAPPASSVARGVAAGEPVAAAAVAKEERSDAYPGMVSLLLLWATSSCASPRASNPMSNS